MGNYFNTNESKTHLAAKEKLFDLIVSKRIKIVDQYNNEYKIFTGEHEDEFLHVESFIMDYVNKAIFSNSDSPCKKYFDDKPNKKPSCSMEGYYGAFKELPCSGCINSNFRRETNHSSNLASYRPDVSFGYEGIHKVWFEIKNSSPCSKNKIEFCKNNGIVLLEISDSVVNGFKDYNGTLRFHKLEEYVHVPTIYDGLKDINNFIRQYLADSKYVTHQEVSNKFFELSGLNSRNFTTRDLIKLQDKIKEEFVTITIDNKVLKDHFGFKKKTSVIITEEENEIVKSKLISESNKKNKVKSDKPVKRICFKCKVKGNKEEMIMVEGKSAGKDIIRYFHKDCM